MALVVPQAALMRLIWSLGGSPYAVNVIGVRKTGAAVIDQALANTVGAQVKAAFSSSGHTGSIGAQASLAQVGLRDISSPNNVEFLDGGAAVPGTDGSTLLPPQVAFVVTLRTARAGKSYRGRVYLPGFATGALAAGGLVNAGIRTSSVAFIEALRTGLPSNGLTLAVVSRKLSTTEVVTAAQGRDLVWDTIRGRATAGI
jgi:hypothetical protein